MPPSNSLVAVTLFWLFTLSLGNIAQSSDNVINDAAKNDVIDNDAERVCEIDDVDGLCSQETLGERYNANKIKVVNSNCKKFRLSDFNSTSPTVIYLESRGRLGNQVR